MFHSATFDEYAVRFPIEETDAVFVTTRVTETVEYYNCGRGNSRENPNAESQCKDPYKDNTTIAPVKYFVAGVDKHFTLGIQSTFQALNFYQSTKDERFAGASQNYYGVLVNSAGNILQVITFPEVS